MCIMFNNYYTLRGSVMFDTRVKPWFLSCQYQIIYYYTLLTI